MMLRHNYVLVLYFILLTQLCWAESTTNDEELDEEFLETLGSFNVDEEDWFEIFWTTIEDEAQDAEKYGEENE